MKSMVVSRLIMDYNLYPRNTIDKQHANYMVESINAGVELPPIIVDEKSLRIIDGFHRATAIQKALGADGKIKIILKKYESDSEMFIDAMKYNSSHGRSLTPYDKTHCIIRAEELQVDPEIVASALNLTTEKYGKLYTERIGTLHPAIKKGSHKRQRQTGSYKGKKIALKKVIDNMAGKELTEKQVDANDKLGGMNQTHLVNQVILLIENQLINEENENLDEKLLHLYSLLELRYRNSSRKVG